MIANSSQKTKHPYTIPKTIKEHPQGDFWGKVWADCHRRDDMFSMILSGKRGKGKTCSTAYLGWLLDRDSNDNPRFEESRISISISEFASNLSNHKLPSGSVIILDDAGLSMYSKDALKSLVKDISKMLMTVRANNPIVLMSLPIFKDLEKTSRSLGHTYAEMLVNGRDNNGMSLLKIQHLQTSSFYGKIYRHNIKTRTVKIHPKHNYKMTFNEVQPFQTYMPPAEIIEPYNVRKKEYLAKWNAAVANRAKQAENKELGIFEAEKSFQDYVNEAKDRADEIIRKAGNKDKMRAVPELIELKFNTSYSLARRLANTLNVLIDEGEINV